MPEPEPLIDLTDDELKRLQFLSLYRASQMLISTTTLLRMIAEIRRRREESPR